MPGNENGVESAGLHAADLQVQLGTATTTNYNGPGRTAIRELAENGHQKPLIFPLSRYPEWRRDPGAITFLKTPREFQIAAKRWIGDSTEAIDYDRVKYWRPFVALATSVDELGTILTRAEGISRIMAIRGAVKLVSLSKEQINRICRLDRDEEPDIEDAPRRWLMIDLDSKPEPTHFNWLDDPRRAALWAAEMYLPSAWKGVRFFYQYSGGAGIKPGLRLHFWFWLDRAYSTVELKSDFARRYGKDRFDLAIFNPVQPHYTAAPVFENRPDPLSGRRSGFAGGAL
jgi:hypothetical protein